MQAASDSFQSSPDDAALLFDIDNTFNYLKRELHYESISILILNVRYLGIPLPTSTEFLDIL